jgi:hypothetical protein
VSEKNNNGESRAMNYIMSTLSCSWFRRYLGVVVYINKEKQSIKQNFISQRLNMFMK